ncbi:phospholipase C/P1 nuclease [Tilletiaria anomala UBC 951]|uniref:Phospholipase C/P1 nuclease n=1 Tax=Tilletiaria anomala (strain ATCC 24038 / CBS 436.72 / UBC 951) TaxID=1037660 RepID=A0A066VEQ9_TILAU|nr:phospholipase C/P1 nuclease [Tilletiaria anomala UBC 951]KDN37244.1 phospholipase C/P1 nuclease [Tilletiaria anomala UBC 951]
MVLRTPCSLSGALNLAVYLVLLLVAAPAVRAWGQVGHAIVATIAQTQLHPAVRAHICSILPDFTAYQSYYPRQGAPHTHCHLAPLASWPDAQHMRYPWSSKLHYINPLQDDPPLHCTYGEEGWASPDNLVTALYNYTSRLQTEQGWERDMAMRMVVHLMGDMGQPLHLTGRDRGGNDVWVRFEGRKSKLHTVWDSLMLQAQIRSLANYTTPLPSARIESALQGRIWDNYIRWLLQEGLGQPTLSAPSPAPPASTWWSEADQKDWLTCPATSEADQSDNTQLVLGQQKVRQLATGEGTICAMAWTKLMHPLVCSYAFAAPVPAPSKPNAAFLIGAGPRTPVDLEEDEDEADIWTMKDAELSIEHLNAKAELARRRRRRRRGPGRHPQPRPYPPPSSPSDPDPQHPQPQPELAELDVPEYFGRINDDKILQMQLAKAGVRLGALLNSLLLDEALQAGH